jgi:hypothetical protein
MQHTDYSTIEGTDGNDFVHFILCTHTFLANVIYKAMIQTGEYDHFKRLTLRPTVVRSCGTGWV